MHLLVKIEFKNSSRYARYAIFTHLCLYFVFYTHCSFVCLLHNVCDFMYICVLSPVFLVLAGLKWHVPDRAISSHSFAIAVFIPCSMWIVKCLNKSSCSSRRTSRHSSANTCSLAGTLAVTHTLSVRASPLQYQLNTPACGESTPVQKWNSLQDWQVHYIDTASGHNMTAGGFQLSSFI